MNLQHVRFVTTAVAGTLLGCAPTSELGDLPLRDSGVVDSAQSCSSPCSADLHSVIDCDGNVVTTCPADQGCTSDGHCVPACESATQNHSAVGCEYFAVNPPRYTKTCFAAFVANTWGTPVSITVDYGGMSLDVTRFAYVPSGTGSSLSYVPLAGGVLAPDSIAILFLSEDAMTKDCPKGVNVATNDAAFTGTAVGQAFHVTTSAPVIAYDIFPYGGGDSAVTSATLLLPVSVWDRNYVGVTGYPQDIPGGTNATPWIALVAATDNTHVTIQPTAAIVGGAGVPGAAKGAPVTYSLVRGEVLRLAQDDDLTGSPVVADQPIGLWGGNGCAQIPAGTIACDGMHQQIPPVKALGHEYAAVRYRNRIDGMEESPPWRLVGMVDGTSLSYDPAPPVGAPTALTKGQLAEFPAAGPFVVRSQDSDHPIYFAAHMTGCGVLGGYASPLGCTGDPEFVNVIPPEQYLRSYIFFTDPTYPETNLVFVRAQGPSGFKDVTLDCAGTLGGWQPVDQGGRYQYTRVDLVRGNFEKQGACDNGRHQAKSDAPFTVTVWGWGTTLSVPSTDAVSYAYPAGAGVKVINTVTVPIQ
jgi:hypothetical protein